MIAEVECSGGYENPSGIYIPHWHVIIDTKKRKKRCIKAFSSKVSNAKYAIFLHLILKKHTTLRVLYLKVDILATVECHL